MNKKDQKQRIREATAKEAEREKENLVIDINEMLEEEKDRAIIVKWDGEEYRIPDRLPALVKIQVMNEDGNVKIDDHDFIFRKLFGDEFADKLESASEDDPFWNDQMIAEKLMQPLFERWFGFKFDDVKKNLTESPKK